MTAARDLWEIRRIFLSVIYIWTQFVLLIWRNVSLQDCLEHVSIIIFEVDMILLKQCAYAMFTLIHHFGSACGTFIWTMKRAICIVVGKGPNALEPFYVSAFWNHCMNSSVCTVWTKMRSWHPLNVVTIFLLKNVISFQISVSIRFRYQ